MTFTNGQIHQAVQAINSISENERAIPPMARFKLAKFYEILEPTFSPIETRRLGLIQTYGGKKQNPQTGQEQWGLWPTDENFPKYLEEWKAICDEGPVEINIKPMTLQMFGQDTKGIQLQELIWLGQLVIDTDDRG